MNKKQFTFLVIICILGWVGVSALISLDNVPAFATAVWAVVLNVALTIYLGINLFRMLGDKE